MDTTRAQPDRQGVREKYPLLPLWLLFGAAAGCCTVLAVQSAQSAAQADGHLPWPVVQWALTTPVGVLILMVAGTAVYGIPSILVWPRIARGRHLAYVLDMTDMPRSQWRRLATTRPAETRRECWLGHGRRRQVISLAILIPAILLALALLGSLIASIAYGLDTLPTLGQICELHSCPPLYPAGSLLPGSVWLALPFIFPAGDRWLSQIEKRCGIRLQWQLVSLWSSRLVYIRRPGVTSEAAAEALAHFVPADGAPRARVIATFVFVVAPMALLLCAGLFLMTWLRLQWIPG